MRLFLLISTATLLILATIIFAQIDVESPNVFDTNFSPSLPLQLFSNPQAALSMTQVMLFPRIKSFHSSLQALEYI